MRARAAGEETGHGDNGGCHDSGEEDAASRTGDADDGRWAGGDCGCHTGEDDGLVTGDATNNGWLAVGECGSRRGEVGVRDDNGRGDVDSGVGGRGDDGAHKSGGDGHGGAGRSVGDARDMARSSHGTSSSVQPSHNGAGAVATGRGTFDDVGWVAEETGAKLARRATGAASGVGCWDSRELVIGYVLREPVSDLC